VAITVPVVSSCTPFDPSLTDISDFVSVTVQQASGRGIASGTGFASGPIFGGMGHPSLLLSCDEAEQTVTVSVAANPSGLPFHGGPAVVTATASASAGEPCVPGSTNCLSNIATQSASAGAVEVHLERPEG